MASTITLETPSGNVKQYIHYRGITYRKRITSIIKTDFATQVEGVFNLDIRDDDVYLATFPKSGTHWLWEILVMLRQGTSTYEEKAKEFAMLDFRHTDEIASLPSPRVLNCHFPAKMVPKQLFEKGTKIVVVHRNIKDVIVSSYHHMQQFNPEGEKADLSEHVKLTIGEFGVYDVMCNWAEYVKGWAAMSEKYPDQILTLHFEDMKEDLVREISKVNKFLGTGRNDTLILDIAEACSFQNLKKADESKQHFPNKPISASEEIKPKPRIQMYRKGEVGDWKNHLTVSDNEKVDEWLSENLTNTDVNFRYTL